MSNAFSAHLLFLQQNHCTSQHIHTNHLSLKCNYKQLHATAQLVLLSAMEKRLNALETLFYSLFTLKLKRKLHIIFIPTSVK